VADISAAMRTLAALVRYPELLNGRDVAAAALAVSEWADANHMGETALHFAEAAAVADPTFAKAAALAGTLCARRTADHRASVWFERAVRVARRTKDWEWYIRGQIRLGILMYELGDFRAARRCYHRARATALWSGHKVFAGKAHHDLLLIEIAVGTYESGEKHALKALEYYPVHYSRLPQLGHDFAVLATTHRHDAEALAILDLVLPLIAKPIERIAVLGTIAKAAAGTGDVTLHRAAVEDVLLLAHVSDENAAGALALAAEGAHALGEWDRAAALADYAVSIAERRHEREPLRRASVVLEQVRARRDAQLADVSPRRERVAETTALFIQRLQRLRAPTTDAGALSLSRAELTKFTIAGR
jgi:tetratricopeptide (TPR) repeat protein